jgi:hypothetical protein
VTLADPGAIEPGLLLFGAFIVRQLAVNADSTSSAATTAAMSGSYSGLRPRITSTDRIATPDEGRPVGAIDNGYELPWGQVLGKGWGLFGAAQDPSSKGATSGETSQVAGKSDGKEGVDGSSPSEGFRLPPASGFFC